MGTKNAKESDTDDSDDDMDNEEEEDDEEEEDIPLDLEEIEAVSKKARQDDEIHSEHMQVRNGHTLYWHRICQIQKPKVEMGSLRLISYNNFNFMKQNSIIIKPQVI